MQRYEQGLAETAIFILQGLFMEVISHALSDLMLTKNLCKQGNSKDSY